MVISAAYGQLMGGGGGGGGESAKVILKGPASEPYSKYKLYHTTLGQSGCGSSVITVTIGPVSARHLSLL